MFESGQSVGLGDGIIKLLGGVVFSLGLIAAVLAEAELFTGNNLIIMAFANGRGRLSGLLHNGVIVYLDNFVGSALPMLTMFMTKQYMSTGGSVGAEVLNFVEITRTYRLMPGSASR